MQHAHKLILSAATEYFELMFFGSFAETDQTEVTINEVDSDALQAMVKYLYCGLLEIKNVAMAADYWAAAHLMKIPGAEKHAKNYISINLMPGNCVGLWLVARLFEDQKLTKECLEHAVSKFQEVIVGEEFLNLGWGEFWDYIKAVQTTVNCDRYSEAILNWIDHNFDDRQVHFSECLQLIYVDRIKEKVGVF